MVGASNGAANNGNAHWRRACGCVSRPSVLTQPTMCGEGRPRVLSIWELGVPTGDEPLGRVSRPSAPGPTYQSVMSASDEPAVSVSRPGIPSRTSSPWRRGVGVFSGIEPHCCLLTCLTYYMAVCICAPSYIVQSGISLISLRVLGWGGWPGATFVPTGRVPT